MQHISSYDRHQVSFTLEERVGSGIGFDFWMRLLKNYNTIPLIPISTTNQNLLASKETFLTDCTDEIQGHYPFRNWRSAF